MTGFQAISLLVDSLSTDQQSATSSLSAQVRLVWRMFFRIQRILMRRLDSIRLTNVSIR